MRRRRRVKIVATLGPASESAATMGELFCAGVDMFRINMSHASRDSMRERVLAIRELETTLRPADRHPRRSAGPQDCASALSRAAVSSSSAGQRFTLDADPANGRRHARASAASGNPGLARARPYRCSSTTASLRCASSRPRRPRRHRGRDWRAADPTARASACPTRVIPIAAMTDKDRGDLERRSSAGVDWIALSFVQRPEDVAEVKKIGARPRARACQDREAPGGGEISRRSWRSPMR